MLALARPAVAVPHAERGCVPIVHHALIRVTPVVSIAAGFFILENPCAAPIVVVGVSSTAFGQVTMHETRVENGISRMHPLPRFTVSPGGRIVFAPGGRHLMLMSPRQALVPGRAVRVELRLGDGRATTADFAVTSAVP